MHLLCRRFSIFVHVEPVTPSLSSPTLHKRYALIQFGGCLGFFWVKASLKFMQLFTSNLFDQRTAPLYDACNNMTCNLAETDVKGDPP